MAAASPADPGVMLNLEHKNMTEYNASGGDDSKLDWRRIPSTDGDCVCVPDPAGLPYFEKAYDNATYLGRVSFTPPWQKTGTGGPPDYKKVTADHWVKWTFHMLVTSKPTCPSCSPLLLVAVPLTETGVSQMRCGLSGKSFLPGTGALM